MGSGTPNGADDLTPYWEQEQAEAAYWGGLTHWWWEGFRLEADTGSAFDLPETKLSCDLCCSVEMGPRLGVVATDYLKSERERPWRRKKRLQWTSPELTEWWEEYSQFTLDL